MQLHILDKGNSSLLQDCEGRGASGRRTREHEGERQGEGQGPGSGSAVSATAGALNEVRAALIEVQEVLLEQGGYFAKVEVCSRFGREPCALSRAVSGSVGVRFVAFVR